MPLEDASYQEPVGLKSAVKILKHHQTRDSALLRELTSMAINLLRKASFMVFALSMASLLLMI